MKLKDIALAIAVTTLPITASASECNLRISENNAAQDLSRVLNCLQKRIDHIEAENLDLKKQLAGGSVQSSPNTFDAGLFSVTVRGASKEGGCITVGTFVKNKTTEEILLSGMERDSVIIDTKTGKTSSIKEFSGIRASHPHFRLNTSKFTTVLPNSSVNFSSLFCSQELAKSKSSVYDLSLHLVNADGDDFKRYAIPLAVKLSD